jgi:hypothetical protein
MQKAGQRPAFCRIEGPAAQNASKCWAGKLVVTVVNAAGSIEMSFLASAGFGKFAQAENTKTAAQAAIRTIRIGGLPVFLNLLMVTLGAVGGQFCVRNHKKIDF